MASVKDSKERLFYSNFLPNVTSIDEFSIYTDLSELIEQDNLEDGSSVYVFKLVGKKKLNISPTLSD